MQVATTSRYCKPAIRASSKTLIVFAQFAPQNFLPLHPHQPLKVLPSCPHQTRCTPYTSKMLYLIGLGLSDETDITVKGLEIVRKAARVYLENYTAILLVETKVLVSYTHALLERIMFLTKYRRNTMAAPSLSRTARWSSQIATPSSKAPIRKM